MKHLSIIPTFLAVAAMIMAAPPAYAQVADVPAAIPYQGHLTDAGGIDVEGAVQIEVRLYDSLIAGLGQGVENSHVIYAEVHPLVQVEEGNFRVAIGEGTPLAAKWTGLPVDELASKDRVFLELWVDGELLTPRQRMGSAAAALRAQHAKYADEIVNLGDISASQMPAYAAERIKTDQFHVDRIPNLNAATISQGSLTTGQLPTSIPVGKFESGGKLSADLFAGLAADAITNGILGTGLMPLDTVYLFGDVAIKIGTLIHGQHLYPPTGFSWSECTYLASPVETSGAVEGIDKMLVYLNDPNTDNMFCRVYGGINDDVTTGGIVCNSHYMVLCKRED